ncbi:probable BOI-related E3 ubiquitin-protein ligase 2 [Salvia miltiorrhiza]|uniref:probable BOI-related E3 ubiquitin-protein ligase 2 n=1 Tax=Salvia miltiorrhiza TaxID=226208 RepID=UPI0025AD0B93|nr:probable BOI-related E3 ubiquitin-protein ligase 2 [Salvia miltiorrhiza]
MLGGNFHGVVEGNRSQYNKTVSPQLQLIGHVPTQYPAGLGMINCVRNECAPIDSRPSKRVREEETVYVQQKLDMSANTNLHLNKPGHSGLLLNPKPVSPGLRLSSEKEERSSSVTSTSENLTNAYPFTLSLGNTVKIEIDRQMEELGQYIKLQEENILKGGREINERHTMSLLNALEKGVSKKLYEKDIEIERINHKNKELEDRIKQVAMEAQSWHYKAKYNESVANALKSNIQQLLAQGIAHGHEGFGDSEVDDALSSLKQTPGMISSSENPDHLGHRLKCRCCKKKQVSILLFPCRHLCLCAECEGFVDVCPICQVMKTASFPVNL